MSSQDQRRPIGQLLVERGLLRDDQVDQVLDYQRVHGLRFASATLALGFVSQSSLINALGAQRTCPYLVIDECPLDAVRTSEIPLSVLRELEVLPCRVFHRSLVVAMPDPGNERILGALESVSRRRVHPVLGLKSVIKGHLDSLPDTDDHLEVRTAEPTPAPLPIPPTQRPSGNEAQEAVRRTERQTEARVGLRDALRALKEGDHNKAVAAARRSMKADPFDSRAHFAMARGLLGLERMTEAVTALEQTVALEPAYYSAWRSLASIQEASGAVEEAIHSWREALRTSPSDEARVVIQARLSKLNEQIGIAEVL